jgi:hypothetical protein
LILHVLNYDHQAPAENVKVRLDLNGLVEDLSRLEVKVLSPDAAQPQPAGLSVHGSVIEFTLGQIEHYAVVTLSARTGTGHAQPSQPPYGATGIGPNES